MKALKIFSILIIVFGFVGIIVGLILTKGDFSNLNDLIYRDEDYTYMTNTDTVEVTKVLVDVNENAVEFFYSQDESYTVNYYVSEYDRINVNIIDGVLSIIGERDFELFRFGSKSEKVAKVEVYLPIAFAGDIKADTATGYIKLNNFNNLQEVNLGTATGYVNISNTNIIKNLIIDTATGSVNVNKVNCLSLSIDVATGRIEVIDSIITNQISLKTGTGRIICSGNTSKAIVGDTGTGSISINNCLSDNIDADTSTGDITINLIGNEDDYSVDLDVSTGSISFQNITTKDKLTVTKGSKFIKAGSSTGDIIVNINN